MCRFLVLCIYKIPMHFLLFPNPTNYIFFLHQLSLSYCHGCGVTYDGCTFFQQRLLLAGQFVCNGCQTKKWVISLLYTYMQNHLPFFLHKRSNLKRLLRWRDPKVMVIPSHHQQHKINIYLQSNMTQETCLKDGQLYKVQSHILADVTSRTTIYKSKIKWNAEEKWKSKFHKDVITCTWAYTLSHTHSYTLYSTHWS